MEFSDVVLGDDRIFISSQKGHQQSGLRLLYLHGGAFVFDLQAAQWSLVCGLMARTGADVVTPIYPLAPEQDWRAGLDMVKRTYLSLARECGPENIIIVGDSAGGGLVLSLALALRDDGLALPAALVMFSPWLDVGVNGEDQPEIERRDPALRIDFLKEAGKMWAGASAVDNPQVSPLFADHKHLPPSLIFTGTRDVLDSDVARLEVKGTDMFVRRYPGMVHVWPIAPIAEGIQALDEAAQFIKWATSPHICSESGSN
jgi:epsilon-lactone hydrolase